MQGIPKESLSKQTRNHLLDQLRRGKWSDGLPAERKLSEGLGVSRPVLRDALADLEKEGYLCIDHRKRRPTLKVEARPQQKRVLIVHSSTEASMPASTAQLLKKLEDHLMKKQIALKSEVCVELKQSEVGTDLAKLHNEYPNEIWILRSPSTAALQWCERHHPQSVVIGAQPDPPYFSGVDLDIDRMLEHSIHLCREQQKCRVVFIVPRGESHAATKLEQFLLNFSESGMTAQMEKIASDQPQQAKRQILHLLSAQPRLNAFICTNFQQWLLVYSVLVEARISPLKDVFIFCHYNDPLMRCISHGVGHYTFDWSKAVDFLAERVVKFSSADAAAVLKLSPMFVKM